MFRIVLALLMLLLPISAYAGDWRLPQRRMVLPSVKRYGWYERGVWCTSTTHPSVFGHRGKVYRVTSRRRAPKEVILTRQEPRIVGRSWSECSGGT